MQFDPWVGKIPWRRAWQPTQYSCLDNLMDRGAWWATVHRVTKSQTQLKCLISTHPLYQALWEALWILLGFPGDSVVKNLLANAGPRVKSLGWEDPREKEMASHSSILSWRIPWTEEPGSLWSPRVGHDLATKQQQQGIGRKTHF